MTGEELAEWGEYGSESGQGERCQCGLQSVVVWMALITTEYKRVLSESE